MKITLLAAAIAVLLSACNRVPPTTVCVRAHDVEYTDMVPVISGIVNGIPTYMYIPEQETTSVCDDERPITMDELAQWHKDND